MGTDDDIIDRDRRRVRRSRALLAVGAVAAAVTIVLATSPPSGNGRDPESRSSTQPAPVPTGTVSPTTHAPGAVRDGAAWPVVAPHRTEVDTHLGLGPAPLAWADEVGDASVGLIDIRYVASLKRSVANGRFVGEWRLSLTEGRSRQSKIGRSDGVLEYGVVVDTDGDRVADCRIGIKDSQRQGRQGHADYRVWVANLRTGVTAERVGAPYGFPIDFMLPEESGMPYVAFFFLTIGEPCDFHEAIHYYVYATVTGADGRVTRDFAPDGAWLAGTPAQS